jgi:hypothetical protein
METLSAYAYQFGSDGKGYLTGGFGSDGSPDGSENFLQTVFRYTLFFQHLEHKTYPAAASNKADVSGIFL